MKKLIVMLVMVLGTMANAQQDPGAMFNHCLEDRISVVPQGDSAIRVFIQVEKYIDRFDSLKVGQLIDLSWKFSSRDTLLARREKVLGIRYWGEGGYAAGAAYTSTITAIHQYGDKDLMLEMAMTSCQMAVLRSIGGIPDTTKKTFSVSYLATR